MKILFIHQNMPGQYKHLARRLAGEDGNHVVFVTKRDDRAISNVRRITYRTTRAFHKETHPYLHASEGAVLHGQAVARVLLDLRCEGFVPDIVVGHPGWGETLFVKDVFPDTPFLNYCEFYYRSSGQDVGFDPSKPPGIDRILRTRINAGPLLQSLEACDQGIAPTEWQRSTHPAVFQPKITTIHDGIDTAALRPDPGIRVTLPDGSVLTRDDEVVTYAARNLEPYRGFASFMRAIPLILEKRPNARILVIGGTGVSYGAAPEDGRSWLDTMLAEVTVDRSRVHFLGHLPYDGLLAALRVSRAHIYLTYPFVLSWSMLEAMALGCVVIGSDTAPVREVIQHGRNGLLVDFFSPQAIADTTAAVLAEPRDFAGLGHAARDTVVAGYDLDLCLRRQRDLIDVMTGRDGRGPSTGIPDAIPLTERRTLAFAGHDQARP